MNRTLVVHIRHGQLCASVRATAPADNAALNVRDAPARRRVLHELAETQLPRTIAAPLRLAHGLRWAVQYLDHERVQGPLRQAVQNRLVAALTTAAARALRSERELHHADTQLARALRDRCGLALSAGENWLNAHVATLAATDPQQLTVVHVDLSNDA